MRAIRGLRRLGQGRGGGVSPLPSTLPGRLERGLAGLGGSPGEAPGLGGEAGHKSSRPASAAGPAAFERLRQWPVGPASVSAVARRASWRLHHSHRRRPDGIPVALRYSRSRICRSRSSSSAILKLASAPALAGDAEALGRRITSGSSAWRSMLHAARMCGSERRVETTHGGRRAAIRSWAEESE